MVICRITNDPKKATNQEKTIQDVIESLTEEYNFEIEDMERDLKLVYVDPDTGKKKRFTANLVIFNEGSPHTQENIIRICLVQNEKTKPTDKKKGTQLLEDMLGAVGGEQTPEQPGCEFGMWTNGADLHFLQKRYDEFEAEPMYEALSDFPGKGENLNDLDRPDRQMLRVAAGESLLKTFKRCHDYIYGNQGKIKTAFWELLNIIFCKIYDERRRDICRQERKTYRRRFWVGVKERNNPEGEAAIAKRIKGLFEEVKQSKEYGDVFTGSEEIALNDRVLSYIAMELSRYSFLEASVDTKGMAYEAIVSNTLKQERGQFFTPRNAIDLMVQMLNPGEQDMVLDPACGSGRFLVRVLEHVRYNIAKELYPDEDGILLKDRANSDLGVLERARHYAREKIFGFDFDPDLKKAARMNMVISGDGHGNIVSFNSLLYPKGADPDMERIKARRIRWGRGSTPGSFDLIFTNPPFGSKIPIDDPDILDEFDLGHRWKKEDGIWRKGARQSSQPPEILFIERCWQFLKPGGRMAIVLPDGILGNPDLEYVRYWILTHTRVLASIDLPVEAFLPQVGVQASLLFLQRKTQQKMLLAEHEQPEYDVFMAIAEKVGKDRRGNRIYVRDEDGAELKFPTTIERLRKRPDGSRKVITRVEHQPEVDDDLPRILEKWRDFLTETGS